MTLNSPPYGLPFQEATDRLCDAPGVWCDLVQVVDSVVADMDLVLGRMDPAVPAASVRQLEPLFISDDFPVSIPFDAVDFDTDGIFNPARSGNRLFPRRAGWYHSEGWTRCQLAANEFGSTIEFYLTEGAFGISAGGTSGSLGNYAEEDNAGAFSIEFFMRVSATLPYVAAAADVATHPLAFMFPALDSSGFGIGVNCAAPGGINILESRFSMHWLRDL